MAPTSLLTNRKLNGQAREMLSNIIKFCEREKLAQGPLIPFDKCLKRVSLATGVSTRTIERIRNEAKHNELTDQPWSTPDKKRKIKSKLGKLNELELCAARRIIHESLKREGSTLTMNKICEALKAELGLDISASTCRRLLRNLGFKWKTTQPNKRILVASEKTPVEEFEKTKADENIAYTQPLEAS